MKLFLTTALTVLGGSFLASSAAFAQGITLKSSAYTFSYESFTYPPTDGRGTQNSPTATAEFDIAFGAQFGLDASLNYRTLSNDPDTTYYAAVLRPYYAISDSVEIGAYAEFIVAGYGSGGSEEFQNYGIDAAFEFGNGFAATISYGEGEALYEGDATFASATGGYAFGNGMDAGAYYYLTTYPDGRTFERYGLSAGYLYQSAGSGVPLYFGGYIGESIDGSRTFESIGLSVSVPLNGHKLGRGQRPGILTHDSEYEFYW